MRLERLSHWGFSSEPISVCFPVFERLNGFVKKATHVTFLDDDDDDDDDGDDDDDDDNDAVDIYTT